MQANVDEELCIGCELCTSICPEVFSMDDDGKSVAITDDIPSDSENSAIDAKET